MVLKVIGSTVNSIQVAINEDNGRLIDSYNIASSHDPAGGM